MNVLGACAAAVDVEVRSKGSRDGLLLRNCTNASSAAVVVGIGAAGAGSGSGMGTVTDASKRLGEMQLGGDGSGDGSQLDMSM